MTKEQDFRFRNFVIDILFMYIAWNLFGFISFTFVLVTKDRSEDGRGKLVEENEIKLHLSTEVYFCQ